MFKFPTLLILLLCLHLQVFAQRDSLQKKGVEPGAISINAGIGYSTISWTEQVGGFNLLGGTGVGVMWTNPAYNLVADYNITTKSSLGIAMAYQSLCYEKWADHIVMTDSSIASRINIAARYLLHLSKKPNNDAYIGMRSGVSLWTINDIQTLEPINNKPQSKTIVTKQYEFSIQFLFGYRAYISKHWALQFEAGIGTPYLLEGGLAYNIFTRK